MSRLGTKKSNWFFHRAVAGVLFLLIFLFTGCASDRDPDRTTVEVGEDGTVTQFIVEDFDADYYDASEMKERIQAEMAAVPKEDGTVSLDACKVKDKLAKVKLTYSSTKAFERFNHEILFFGSVKEAEAAGYHLPSDQLEVRHLNKNGKILISNTEAFLRLPEKVKDVSKGLKKVDDHTVDPSGAAYETYMVTLQ